MKFIFLETKVSFFKILMGQLKNYKSKILSPRRDLFEIDSEILLKISIYFAE